MKNVEITELCYAGDSEGRKHIQDSTKMVSGMKRWKDGRGNKRNNNKRNEGYS